MMDRRSAEEPLRIALAGCGNAGMNHGREIVASGRWTLVAVCDVRPEGAAAAAAALGGVHAYTDFGRMLASERLDAVAVITPPHVHIAQVVAAAARRLHVLCEKPLGITVAECEKAVAACRQAGVLLGVTYTYHFVQDFRRMREIVDRGEIGAVREVRWLRYGGAPAEAHQAPPPPRPAHHREAVIPHLFDCGVHAFDLMRWFAGSPVTDIRASALAAGPGWEPEAVTIVFLYAAGQRGVYDSGAMTCLPGCDRGQPALSFLVVGSKGSMVWDFKGGWSTPRGDTRITVHTAQGSRVETLPVYSKCRDIQYAEFAQAIHDGALPPHWPTPELAIEATRMAVDAVAAVGRDTVRL